MVIIVSVVIVVQANIGVGDGGDDEGVADLENTSPSNSTKSDTKANLENNSLSNSTKLDTKANLENNSPSNSTKLDTKANLENNSLSNSTKLDTNGSDSAQGNGNIQIIVYQLWSFHAII